MPHSLLQLTCILCHINLKPSENYTAFSSNNVVSNVSETAKYWTYKILVTSVVHRNSPGLWGNFHSFIWMFLVFPAQWSIQGRTEWWQKNYLECKMSQKGGNRRYYTKQAYIYFKHSHKVMISATFYWDRKVYWQKIIPTYSTHNAGIDDFHFKVILCSCERFGSNVKAYAAVIKSIISAHYNSTSLLHLSQKPDIEICMHCHFDTTRGIIITVPDLLEWAEF